MKGGISFPLVLVVTIIIIAIVIALAYLFLFNTKENIEGAFGDLAGSIASFACSGLGIASGAVCPS
jgi:uncharacterized protein (UPF0333 family)